MIAGGFDDFSEEGSFKFANMGTTSNSTTEFAIGCVSQMRCLDQ